LPVPVDPVTEKEKISNYILRGQIALIQSNFRRRSKDRCFFTVSCILALFIFVHCIRYVTKGSS
jgi:hypothetical protein